MLHLVLSSKEKEYHRMMAPVFLDEKNVLRKTYNIKFGTRILLFSGKNARKNIGTWKNTHSFDFYSKFPTMRPFYLLTIFMYVRTTNRSTRRR